MPTKYYWDNEVEDLKSKLTSIIDVPNEDNFRTHFRQTILFKDENKVSGTIKQDGFKIWTHEQGARWCDRYFLSNCTGTNQTFKSRM